MSSDGNDFGLLLILFRHHTSDGLLELAVVGGVDERIDTAVGEHQNHGEVVGPGCKVDRVADIAEIERDFNWCPAHDESAADHQ